MERSVGHRAGQCIVEPAASMTSSPQAFETLRPRLAECLADARNRVILDFDHTLFAANSTELFLATARPAFLASFLLWLVRELPPWHLGSADKWFRVRDWLSVLAVVLVMPWHLRRWRRLAPGLWQAHAGSPLPAMTAAIAPERMLIVSFGYEAIIAPLLHGTHWQTCPRQCARLFPSLGDLFRGKRALLAATRPDWDPAQAVFVTDSEHDRDLLDAAAHPFLVPRFGDIVVAQERLYFPLRYAGTAKYQRVVIIEHIVVLEFPLVLLATWRPEQFGLAYLGAALALFVSMFCIYEIGYFENDMQAATREAAPTLRPGFARFRDFPLPRHAWVWAATLGLLGCVLAARIGAPTADPAQLILANALRWALVLGAVRGIFHLYNRQREARRVLLYPALQFAKLFALAAILPLSLLGAALLCAQIVTVWMQYAIYRLGGRHADVARDPIRATAFLLLIAAIALSPQGAALRTEAGAAAAIALWFAWRVVRGRFWRLAARLARRLLARLRPTAAPPSPPRGTRG